MPRKETAMNEMIERVAKAIDKSAEDWAANLPGWSDVDIGRGRYTKADCPHLVMARAAIEAMRKPTDAMVQAGNRRT